MPFIWDDVKWMLVDEDAPYDKSRFVIVRKLHIKLNKSPWQNTVSIKLILHFTFFYSKILMLNIF